MRALLTRMAADGAVEKKLAEGKFSVRAARATRELWEKERGEYLPWNVWEWLCLQLGPRYFKIPGVLGN